MGTEQNVDVVSVINTGKLLVHFVNVHLWRERQGFHKEHAILKAFNIWLVCSLPEYLNWLSECSWDESTVWLD